MQNAGIIIIGNEILSGRTLDKNSNFICSRCSILGIDVIEVKVIGDIKKTIIKNVLEYSRKFDQVFVTGGIGPTHDDITSEAISQAFKKKYQLNKRAKKLLVEHYKKSNLELNESRLKMARLPSSSKLILNPVSAAPGFYIKNVWVMAGVPKIMQAMFTSHVEPILQKGKPFISEEIIVNSPEGDIAHLVEKVQTDFLDIEVGSYPFYNPPNIGTNIIIRGRNKTSLRASKKYLCDLLTNNSILFTI